MSVSPTKKDNITESQPYEGEFLGILRWGEFSLNSVLTENNIEMYQDYIHWIEKLAKKHKYPLSLPVYEKIQKNRR